MIVKPGIPENLKWFQNSRYGMMIHFGLYAILGRGEWVMLRENIHKEDYEKLVPQFNPAKFDADEWVDLAVESGCRYITFTAKHHDGFCMYDSAYTDYKITNTPFGRDLMGELIDACHRRGLRIIIYYSQPDWHHINYVNWPGAFKDLDYMPTNQQPDWPKYQDYLFKQVEEICTKYGRIDGIFFDGSHKTEEMWRGKELYAMIKRHQPDAVVNDRARCGDMFTPERAAVENIDRKLAGKYLLEICTSVTTKGWGYTPNPELTSVSYHIEQMVKAARIGCNYALNIGPAPDGSLPAHCQEVYRQIGRWMEHHKEGYQDTEPVYPNMDDDRYVMLKRDNCLYLFCLKWPDRNSITIPSLKTNCRDVTLMSTGGSVSFRREGDDLVLFNLPLAAPDSFVQAFRIELETVPDIEEKQKKPEIRPVVALTDDVTNLTPETAIMEGYGVKGVTLKAAAQTVGEMSDSSAEKGTVLEKNFIIRWMTPDQHAIWQIQAERETVCGMTVELLMSRDYSDTEATVRVNGEEVTVAMPTDVPIGSVTEISIGTFTFKPGMNIVDMNASKPKWGYMFRRSEALH